MASTNRKSITPAQGSAQTLPQGLISTVSDASDCQVGLLFCELYGDRHRYVCDGDYWIWWDGKAWRPDAKAQELTNDLHAMMTRVSNSHNANGKAVLGEIVKKISSNSGLRNIKGYLAQMKDLVIHLRNIDAYEHLLACENGVYDTDTFQMITDPKALQKFYLMHRMNVSYVSDATAPNWDAFLRRIFANDEEVVRYVQKAVGLSLSAKVLEEKLFFAYGSGANGKSTFFLTLQYLFGNLHAEIDSTILLKSGLKDQRLYLENADKLRKVRFATTNEIPERSTYNDAALKSLSSRDEMSAKKIYESTSSFRPSHKLWIRSNHKPGFNVHDGGILRRLCLIPFLHTIPLEERVQRYEDILLKEAAGIFNWIIQGWELYCREGMREMPQAMETALREYMNENDTTMQFMTECCESVPGETTKLSEITSKYNEWARENGYRSCNSRALKRSLEQSGYSITSIHKQHNVVDVSIIYST